MATRGRKPKPVELHVVAGTLNTTRHREARQAPEPNRADVAKPKYLKGRAAKLWEEVTGMCWWLGDSDSYKTGMWCALQPEFERGPVKMTAARINALRALGSELGLDPATRARLGSMKGNRKTDGGTEEKKTPAAKYF